MCSLPLVDGVTLERGQTIWCATGTVERLGRSTRGAPAAIGNNNKHTCTHERKMSTRTYACTMSTDGQENGDESVGEQHAKINTIRRSGKDDYVQQYQLQQYVLLYTRIYHTRHSSPCYQAGGAAVGDRSLGTRQSLFWP